MIKKIRHTGITVTDMDVALNFYRDLLKFKVVLRDHEESDYIDTISGFSGIKLEVVKLTADDDSMIELLYYESHPVQEWYRSYLYDAGISHIAFQVSAVDAVYEELSAAGVSFISPPTVSPNNYAKVAFCRDPDGNLIELVEVL